MNAAADHTLVTSLQGGRVPGSSGYACKRMQCARPFASYGMHSCGRWVPFGVPGAGQARGAVQATCCCVLGRSNCMFVTAKPGQLRPGPWSLNSAKGRRHVEWGAKSRRGTHGSTHIHTWWCGPSSCPSLELPAPPRTAIGTCGWFPRSNKQLTACPVGQCPRHPAARAAQTGRRRRRLRAAA